MDYEEQIITGSGLIKKHCVLLLFLGFSVMALFSRDAQEAGNWKGGFTEAKNTTVTFARVSINESFDNIIESNFAENEMNVFAKENSWDLQLPPFDSDAANERQQYAQHLLQSMDERKAFETIFSNQRDTLQQGFLRSWEPCVLERIIQRKEMLLGTNNTLSRSLNVVVVGGSASARPANKCQLPNNVSTSGRYSDRLEWNLQQEHPVEKRNSESYNIFPHFQVFNRAQGTCGSTVNAILIDNLIEASTTDVVIWEFLINDHHGDLAEQTRKLDFWLTCVKRHFQAAKLPPPAILLNYLWTFNANGIAKKGWSIDAKPMTYAGELIDVYRDIGWDIAAVHAGAAVNVTRLKKQRTELFDDMHHPSCTGVKFIANLLQHVFYSNLATQCTANSFPKRWERHTTTNSLIPPHATLTGNNINSTTWTPLWRDIFREDATVASLSAWSPKSEAFSRIAFSNSTILKLTKQYVDGILGKAAKGRTDRKFTFQLPCNMTLSFREPNLKWIGVGKERGKFSILVNGVAVPQPRADCNWMPGPSYTCFWINLEEAQVARADSYDVSFCQEKSDKTTVTHIISVAIPVTNQ